MLRVITGRSLHEVDVGKFAERAARHAGVAIDLGTGDGRHVLAAAAASPDVLARVSCRS